MMKLAYRVCIVTLILVTFVFAASAQDVKNPRSAKDDRNTAPTVGTGGPVGGPTGLFTVYDGQTLRKGEFTFSAAYSNYDRDPGNADIVEVPVSFQVGLTDNFELFFNTDALRYVKINSPRNISGFYLPNSRVLVNGLQSGPAIILAPSGPGNGAFENRAVFRPTGTQPFIQFPYIGGTAGNFGLPFSGPAFGFPANTNASLGPPTPGGNGADNFPGIGSVFGSILPGVVLQTRCPTAAACPQFAEIPTVFTLAPAYLPDAPLANRTYGESSFSTYTVGGKWRFTGLNNPIGFGVIGYYRFFADNANDLTGFNQLQRGASPGGNRGDFGGVLFLDGRLASWANLSANLGYHYNSSIKGDFPGGTFTLLDRPDELLMSVGVDFPINKFFQPIFEFRSLKYTGGRTPNAFENDPLDGIAGFRVFPTRFASFGFAYRYHANEQDQESFDPDGDLQTGAAFVPCNTTATPGCSGSTFISATRGAPPGFQFSENPHGYIIQATVGRRNKRQAEIANIPANVTALTLSDTEVVLGCPAGTSAPAGQCNESTSVNVSTTAVDTEKDVLTYNYTVSGGRIVGDGANVAWDLSGAQAGTYTITAGVNDGCGLCGQTKTETVRIVPCPNCIPPPEIKCECHTLDVNDQPGITNPGETMTFTAVLSGGSGSTSNVTYNWSVSAGTIESGQGTPSIVVRTTREMALTNVTATVQLNGLDSKCDAAGCPKTDSGSGGVADYPRPELVDEIGKLENDVVRGRLDDFFRVMANNPNNQGYIINYGTDKEIATREKLITNHINFRKEDRSRYTLVRGGDTGTGINTKLYRVPPGADNPAP